MKHDDSLLNVRSKLLFLCMILLPLIASAQKTCTINNLDFKLDDVKNKKNGLTVHLSMTVKGMLNKKGKVFVFICDENGKYISGVEPGYCTSDNSLCKITSYTPSYQNSTYNDFTTFIPYSVISKSITNKPKSKVLKIKVIVADDNNKAIASKLSASKFSYLEWTNMCVMCGGKGISPCRICGGLRQRPVTTLYGLSYVTCEGCNGTGQGTCFSCGGRGNMGTNINTYYINAYKPQQGNSVVAVPPVNSHSGSSVGSSSFSSSTRPSNSRRECPMCHGTGKGSEIITWAPEYTSAERYCSTCGKVTGIHSHHTPSCGTCYGKGYID